MAAEQVSMRQVSLDVVLDNALLVVECRSTTTNRIFRASVTGADAAQMLRALARRMEAPIQTGDEVLVKVDGFAVVSPQ